MTTVTLYEAPNGDLFLHLDGEAVLWQMHERTASTFLTDAVIVANGDTAAHPTIFSSQIPRVSVRFNYGESTDTDDGGLRPIAILKLNPDMGLRGAAYTLFTSA